MPRIRKKKRVRGFRFDPTGNTAVVGAAGCGFGGVSWQQYDTASGRRLLRHTFGTVTVIVTGSAAQPELADLAGSVS